MRTILFFLCFTVPVILLSCRLKNKVGSNVRQQKYLEKTALIRDKRAYGQSIVLIKPPPENWADDFIAKDDRATMGSLNFTREMRIQVLRELLSYENDTVKSNKLFYIRGRWKNVESKDFTIEVEALYSFTRMLTRDMPRMLPVLIERKTGKDITGERTKNAEIYAIYRKWLKKNEKSNFQHIQYPLTGTPFDWDGGEDNDIYLNKAF